MSRFSMLYAGKSLWFVLVAAVCFATLSGAGCGGSTPTTIGLEAAQLPNTGVRATSTPTYTPGVPLVVSVSVVPDNGSVAYAIEDAPPAGWTVSNINEGGIFDPLTGKVKWGIFFNQCPTYFSYTATPPANVSGTQTLTGTLSVDGTNSALTGQISLPHS